MNKIMHGQSFGQLSSSIWISEFSLNKFINKKNNLFLWIICAMQRSMNRDVDTGMIFLDLAKAFDGASVFSLNSI